MNGPALIGILATIAVLALIYAISGEDSPWPCISFLLAGVIGILALDLHWPVKVVIFALIGGGWAAKRAFDRLSVGAFLWEFSVEQPNRGLGGDWRARYGGDATSPNWGGYGKTGPRAEAHGKPWRSIDHLEALKILCLDENATESDIGKAHRRLMKKHHPDRGGSTEMAAKLNRARELLLRRQELRSVRR